MKEVNAVIITIGDELLIGQTIDTNSAFISQELNKIGIWVKRRIAIGDAKEEILNALKEQSKDCDLVIITGGLGPTADDITKPALCEYFNSNLVINEEALQNVKAIFTKLNKPLIDRNLKQAEVPHNCTVLQNERGTAPGMWWEAWAPQSPKGEVSDTQPLLNQDANKNSDTHQSEALSDGLTPLGGQEGFHLGSKGAARFFISLPGVPHEMKGLLINGVLPKLKKEFELPVILHKTALVAGKGESEIAEIIFDFESRLPPYIKLAYLPAYGMLRLRLTAKGDENETVQKDIDQYFDELKKLVKEWLVADEDITLQEAVNRLLKEKKKTASTAESCTGGYIAHLITSVSGSSEIFNGSVVSYSNDAKENLIGVQHITLKKFGAVSEETVKEMAEGVRQAMKTDYAIATSGIMGPGGGSDKKPAGMVWIAVGNKNKVKAQKFFFRFDRSRNTELTAHTALNMLRRFVLEEEDDKKRD